MASRSARKRSLFLFLFFISLGIMGAKGGFALAAPQALIIGGGPNPQSDQVGIESNVRYVSRLLPPGTHLAILFADGSTTNATVEYEANPHADDPPATPGARAFSLLFDTDSDDDSSLKYRPPKLTKIDGPSQLPSITSQFDRIGRELADSPAPLFLYFTGHGSQSGGLRSHSEFDLWGRNASLSPAELARQLKKIPASTPIVLVMAQCFSGGFGDLLFDGGDPTGDYLDRDFAGFYAATPDRVSAGCTDAVNEAEYKDFTSYFFAALTGQDRLGHKVTGADYDKDGHVGMDEAYAYSLIADESLDVPVASSDFFLRRFVKTEDEDIFKTPYSKALGWTTPAQKAAIESLSKRLRLSGEDQLGDAYGEIDAVSRRRPRQREAMNRYRKAEAALRNSLLQRWPALTNPKSSRYADAKKSATRWLDGQAKTPEVTELFAADDALTVIENGPEYTMRQTLLLRYVRLAKSVILAHQLEASGDKDLIAKWDRLKKAEARPFYAG
jgi:hypothetical protein